MELMRLNNRLKLIAIWKNGLILIGIALLSLATFRPALACSPGASDSTSVSANGKYVLVLYLVRRPGYPGKIIRRLYIQMTVPIKLYGPFRIRPDWKQARFLFLKTGKTLSQSVISGPQVWFYKAGSLLNEYDEKYFGIAAQRCFTDWLKTTTYDRALEQVSLETTSNSTYKFDLNTGKVLSENSTPSFAFFLGPALAALGIVALVLIGRRLIKIRKTHYLSK